MDGPDRLDQMTSVVRQHADLAGESVTKTTARAQAAQTVMHEVLNAYNAAVAEWERDQTDESRAKMELAEARVTQLQGIIETIRDEHRQVAEDVASVKRVMPRVREAHQKWGRDGAALRSGLRNAADGESRLLLNWLAEVDPWWA